MENVKKIHIEVAYARPDAQVIVPLEVAEHTTIEEAIRLSGVLDKFPEIDLSVQKVGVFGKLSKLSSTLRHNDRIEIYRPLLADPKEVRKNRAAQNKQAKGPAGKGPAAE